MRGRDGCPKLALLHGFSPVFEEKSLQLSVRRSVPPTWGLFVVAQPAAVLMDQFAQLWRALGQNYDPSKITLLGSVGLYEKAAIRCPHRLYARGEIDARRYSLCRKRSSISRAKTTQIRAEHIAPNPSQLLISLFFAVEVYTHFSTTNIQTSEESPQKSFCGTVVPAKRKECTVYFTMIATKLRDLAYTDLHIGGLENSKMNLGLGMHQQVTTLCPSPYFVEHLSVSEGYM